MHHSTFPPARAAIPTCHLMQSAARQSASRQMPVDRLDAEGQHGSPARGRTFEALDACAKLLDNRQAGGRPHEIARADTMFPICSFYAKRVKRILTEGLPEPDLVEVPLPLFADRLQ